MAVEHIDLMLRLLDGVTAPLRSIQKQVQDTAKYHSELGKSVQRIGEGYTRMGETLLPIATGITALGVAGGKAFVDFDAIITGAAAKAGATAQEMELMRQKASQFGADFPISATQAAEGMDRLAAAGYNANEVIGVMPSIVTAAVASGEDLATTSDVVSNALNIWDMKQGDIATNAAHVADVVQMAANKSSLGMQDFGVAMQYAGAPAHTLGVDIESLSTAMAIMKNNGIEASTIGTSLRSVFSRLSAPPKEAAEAIEKLGLKVKDANGNFVGLQPIIEQLRGGLLNLSNTEQVALAKALAGEEAYSGLLALVKTSPEAYQEMSDAMYNASGSSQAQFDIMKNTVKNAIDGMTGSFESLAISFGDALKPQIIAVLDTIGSFADMINSLPPGVKLVTADILMGTVAFTGLLLAVGKLITLKGSVIKLFGDIGEAAKGGTITNKALESSVKSLSGAFDNINGYVNKLKANDGKIPIFKAIEDNFNKMRTLKWADVGSSVAGAMPKNPITTVKTTAITNLQRVKTSAIEASKSIMNLNSTFSMSKFIKTFTNNTLRAVKSLGALTRASIAFAFSPLGIALIAIAGAAYLIYANWNTVGPFFITLWRQIQTAAVSAWARLQPTINNLKRAFNLLINALRPAINSLRQVFNAVRSGTGAFAPLLGIIKLVAVVLGGTLIGAFSIFANVITGVIIAAINVVTAVINMFLGVLTGIITFITGVFTGNWSMAWQGIVDIFSSIFSGIADICSGVMEGVKATINGVIDSINGISVDIPEWVPGFGGKHFGPLGIPHLYTGTDNWLGGPAVIHDKGGEIVDLPNGSRVIPHEKSLQTAYAQGQRASADSGINININIYGANMSNDGDCERLARKVASIIASEMSKRSINMNVGAI